MYYFLDEAFSDCKELENIELPYAKYYTNFLDIFSECKKLIKYERGVYYVGNYLAKCEENYASISVNINNGTLAIGPYALEKSGVTNITIPNAVNGICNNALYNCKYLEDIEFNGTTDEWTAILKGENWDNGTGEYTVYCTDGTVAKDGTVTGN